MTFINPALLFIQPGASSPGPSSPGPSSPGPSSPGPSTGSGAQAAPLVSPSPAPATQTLKHLPHQEAKRQHLMAQLPLNTKPATPHRFSLSHDMDGNNDSKALHLHASLAPEIGGRLVSLLEALPADAFVHDHNNDVWTVADYSFSSGEGAGWTLALAGSGNDIQGYRLTDPEGESVSWPEPVSDSPSGDGPMQQGWFAGKKRPHSSSSSSATNSVISLAASAAPAEGASDGDVQPRTIYDDIKADAMVLDIWEKLPENQKTTGDLYQALFPPDSFSSAQKTDVSGLKVHFDSHLVRMEIERMHEGEEKATLRQLHDRQQAYDRKRLLPPRSRPELLPPGICAVYDISNEDKRYLAERVPKLRRAAIERLLKGSFTEAAEVARAYDDRPGLKNRSANAVGNTFLARCFSSVPFQASVVAIADDKPEGAGKTEREILPTLTAAFHVDRWLADRDNVSDPDAFLNPKKDWKSLGMMLKIKQKISHAFSDNSFVQQGLRIWREEKHSLGLDTPFIKSIENTSLPHTTTKTWPNHRALLAEYPLVAEMSDREFIGKLNDLETQTAVTLWMYGPLERRPAERDADFAKRKQGRVTRTAFLMRFLANAPAVQAYAKALEAQKRAGAGAKRGRE
jgi:hypothetical protein